MAASILVQEADQKGKGKVGAEPDRSRDVPALDVLFAMPSRLSAKIDVALRKQSIKVRAECMLFQVARACCFPVPVLPLILTLPACAPPPPAAGAGGARAQL